MSSEFAERTQPSREGGAVERPRGDGRRLLSSPSGVTFSAHEYDDVWSMVRHADHKVRLAVPRLLDWLASLDPATDADDPASPFTLVNGQRRMHNANQIFRTPAWRRSDPDGALRVHPADLDDVGGQDGGWVEVATETGRLVVRAEVDDTLRRGVVSLPHGYGQAYPVGGGERARRRTADQSHHRR